VDLCKRLLVLHSDNFVKKTWMVCGLMILAIRGQLQKLDKQEIGGSKDCSDSRIMTVLCEEIPVIISINRSPATSHGMYHDFAHNYKQHQFSDVRTELCLHHVKCSSSGNTHCDDKCQQCGISPADCPYKCAHPLPYDHSAILPSTPWPVQQVQALFQFAGTSIAFAIICSQFQGCSCCHDVIGL